MGLGALYLGDILCTREEKYVQILHGQTGRLYRRLPVVAQSIFSFCSMIIVPPSFSWAHRHQNKDVVEVVKNCLILHIL